MALYKATVKDKTKNVRKAAKTMNVRNLNHLLAVFRLKIQKTIGKLKKPRKPGKPATSPTGQLYNSIRYAIDSGPFFSSGVIGPARSDIGLIGKLHEAGGKHEIKTAKMLVRREGGKLRRVRGPEIMTDASYPARPFMGPTFEKFKPKLPKFWQDSLRGLSVGE